MDGKTLKGTIPSEAARGTHLLRIYVPQQGLVLAEAEVDRKENELVMAPKILQQVNLKGAIVIGDTIKCPTPNFGSDRGSGWGLLVDGEGQPGAHTLANREIA